MTKKPTVIDLSHYQPHVDLLTARQDGVLGVIHKATEGTGWRDGLYKSRRDNAATLGLSFAPYHFLKPGSIEQQAANFLQFADPPKGGRVFIDYEDNGLKLADLKTMILAIEALDETLAIGIYGGSLLKQHVGSAALSWLAPYPLWLAHYTTGLPTWPKATWPVWSLWQFTDKAEVAGVGRCDGNVFNGTDANLKKFLDPVPGPSMPVDEKEGEVVINVSLPPGVTLEVFVNGEKY